MFLPGSSGFLHTWEFVQQRKASMLAELTRNTGKWALITGASGGIGQTVAIALAAQGFNIGTSLHTSDPDTPDTRLAVVG